MSVYFCSAFGVRRSAFGVRRSAGTDATTSGSLQITSGASVSEALAGRGGGGPRQTEKRKVSMQRDPIAAPISRRRFLAASGGAAAGLFAPLEKLIDAQPPLNSGRFVRTLPLGDPARLDDPPLNQLLGAGLDARLFTDLSR